MVEAIPYNTAFIINPAGGSGNSGRIWVRIAQQLDQSGQRYLAYFTEARGDGTRLAEQAVAAGAELVVAVGGDGTIREVINGINVNKNILGIIPLGTGNGFRRSCNIPGQWESALNGLSQWSPRVIDIGEVNGTLFLNVVGIGFDAAVENIASGKYKNLKGYLSYIAAFFKELVSFKAFHSSLVCDGTVCVESDTLLVVAANGSYYGGNMCIAPQARIDDGYLDICLIKKMKALETTFLALKVLLKKPLDHESVITKKTRQIYIYAENDVPVHIDGEVIGKMPIEIKIKPSALRVLAPAG